MAQDVVRHSSSVDLSSPLTLTQCSATARKRRWSFPATGYLDLSSSQGTLHKSVVSIAPPARSQDKTSLSFMDEYRFFMEQYRPFWSFVVYISLAQIVVFVYHVILAANFGFTMGLWGPVYRKVEKMYKISTLHC